MKLAEMPRHEKADQQYANRKSKNVTYRAQVKVADARHKKVAGDGVEEAPKNVHCGRGQPLAGRLCEGRLKGLSHHAADIMRNGVGQENSSKEIRHKMKPGHGYALLVASRLSMSWVEPVSPSRGKTLARLYACASGRKSVMASRASVTLNPCSYAHQSSMRRASRVMVEASLSCSWTESLFWIVVLSQSCLVARPSPSNFWHFRERAIKVCRLSFGSGEPRTNPASSNDVMMALID